MPTNWRAVQTVCPFYRKEDAQRITCEGIPKDTTCAINFQQPSEKRAYKKRFCEKRYQECPYAKMLYRKWDYD